MKLPSPVLQPVFVCFRCAQLTCSHPIASILVAGRRLRPSRDNVSSSALRHSRRAHLLAPPRYRELWWVSGMSSSNPLPVDSSARTFGHALPCSAYRRGAGLLCRTTDARLPAQTHSVRAHVWQKICLWPAGDNRATLPQCSHRSGCRSSSSRPGALRRPGRAQSFRDPSSPPSRGGARRKSTTRWPSTGGIIDVRKGRPERCARNA